MKQFTNSLGKGKLAFLPQMDPQKVTETMLASLNEDMGISTKTLQDLKCVFGNVMNDLKIDHEARKQAHAEDDRNGAHEDHRCGG